MEKKTNKAKLKIFTFQPKLCLLWKFNKYTLTRVFLHAELMSAMKTVQNPTAFMKTQK